MNTKITFRYHKTPYWPSQYRKIVSLILLGIAKLNNTPCLWFPIMMCHIYQSHLQYKPHIQTTVIFVTKITISSKPIKGTSVINVLVSINYDPAAKKYISYYRQSQRVDCLSSSSVLYCPLCIIHLSSGFHTEGTASIPSSSFNLNSVFLYI